MDAHEELNQLDRKYGSRIRQQMWSNDSGLAQHETICEEDREMTDNVELAIAKLDDCVKEMLYIEYLLSYPYNSNTIGDDKI